MKNVRYVLFVGFTLIVAILFPFLLPFLALAVAGATIWYGVPGLKRFRDSFVLFGILCIPSIALVACHFVSSRFAGVPAVWSLAISYVVAWLIILKYCEGFADQMNGC